MSTVPASPFQIANIRLFILFRILFNARFYYPVFTVLFLDFGLSLQQFAILNSIWAATIVCLEVPSGALADTFGRRTLLRVAAILMFFEMALICFLPLGNNSVIFWGIAANRILSGAAEASASGADEALAFDSLASSGQTQSWSVVLEFLMRWQSAAFIFALLVGSLVYDAHSLNSFFSYFGINTGLHAETTMRFPLYLVFVSSVIVLYVTFRMEEVGHTPAEGEVKDEIYSKCSDSLSKMYEAAKWIFSTPFALLVICAGLLFDNVIRMILTLNSQYYRMIGFPAWSFGVLGAAFSVLGFFVPALAGKMIQKNTAMVNLCVLSLLCFAGLTGMTYVWQGFGLLPFCIVYSLMYFVGFMVSNYLNPITPSEMRATVLSFKGLAFNLAYGLIGVLYSLLAADLNESIKSAQPQLDAESLNNKVYISALQYFPHYFLFTLLCFAILFLYVMKNGREKR